MGLTRGTVDDACAWYRAIAMHGMHGEEQSQEQVDQKGVQCTVCLTSYRYMVDQKDLIQSF